MFTIVLSNQIHNFSNAVQKSGIYTKYILKAQRVKLHKGKGTSERARLTDVPLTIDTANTAEISSRTRDTARVPK